MKLKWQLHTINRRTKFLLLVGALSAAIGAFTAFYINQTIEHRRTESAAPLIGQLRPDFRLYDLNDKHIPISTWDGKIVLINFWATWCPPCRREIPIFSEVRESFKEDGFEVVGIAVDEKDKVIAFLDAMPSVRYPQLIGYNDAISIAQSFGNLSGGLPYSVLLDHNGIIRFIKAGELDKDSLVIQIESLL